MSGFAEVFIEFISTDDGGRRSPVFLGYRPHFVIHNGDAAYLAVEFVDAPDDGVHPGAASYAAVRFMCEPDVSYAVHVVGETLDIREGSRTVGFGRITRR